MTQLDTEDNDDYEDIMELMRMPPLPKEPTPDEELPIKPKTRLMGDKTLKLACRNSEVQDEKILEEGRNKFFQILGAHSPSEVHKIPSILEEYSTSVNTLEEVHRQLLWKDAAKGRKPATEFGDDVAMEPVHSTSVRGFADGDTAINQEPEDNSSDGDAATEEEPKDNSSDNEEQPAAALHSERRKSKKGIKDVAERTGADIATRMPVQGDHAIEILEELAHRKNRPI